MYICIHTCRCAEIQTKALEMSVQSHSDIRDHESTLDYHLILCDWPSTIDDLINSLFRYHKMFITHLRFGGPNCAKFARAAAKKLFRQYAQ